MTIQVHVVNAFPLGEAGGNPAGIVLDDDRAVPAEARQAVAAWMNLSETVFISKPSTPGAAFRLEFFTPTRQIAHCGHATIAAFSFLAQQRGLGPGILVKETIEKPRNIMIREGKIFMEQAGPRYEDPGVAPAEIAAALGLRASDVAAAPVVASTGNRFLLVPLGGREPLKAARPDLKRIEELSERLDLIGFYPFVVATQGEAAAHARMFAPRYGIAEESATGMAAGPLACWLRDKAGQERRAFVISQGEDMPEPSPSRIEVELDLSRDGSIAGLKVGGGGRLVRTQHVVVSELL